MKKLLSMFVFISLVNVPMAFADRNHEDKKDDCPVGLVKGLTLDEEFGEGIQAVTRCLENRKKIKLVMQINKACRDTTVVATNTGYAIENHARSCAENRGYGIAQLKNMLADYKVTHGIDAKRLDVNVIVHGGGGTMMLDLPWNKLKPAVESLIAEGVKFRFCQNTVRGMAPKMGMTVPAFVSKVIPGVTYVTAGLTAVADFQEEGYMYIQP